MYCAFKDAEWLNKPINYSIRETEVIIETVPKTDFWQKTYYGFQRNNGHGLLISTQSNFTFSGKAEFDYKSRFDQCGFLVYVNKNNWFKVSIEHENTFLCRLGSVLTQNGYSDWATRDIDPVGEIWYRLSRRGPDFLAEYSFDGTTFDQMRIFHIVELGDTTSAMAQSLPPFDSDQPVRFGLYACSPGDSSFKARFTELELKECIWQPHRDS